MTKVLSPTARKRFQATVALLVLISLFVPFSATYLWLHIQKWVIKKEVKAKLIRGLDKSELTHFIFSKAQIESELRWEHHKEFEYKGEMYDVVETEVKGDSIHYVCWHDKAETKLNQRLKTLIAQATSSTPEQQKRESLCYQLLKSLVMQSATELWLEPAESSRKFHTWLVQYEFIVLQKVKKPPPFSSAFA